MGESETSSQRCMNLIATGSCPLDLKAKSDDMPLPIVPDDPNASFTPTPEFVEGMIASFKNGGKIPRRLAWEIILGVKRIVEKEKSLVEVTVPEGAVCDIIGDTHGVSAMLAILVGDTLTVISNSLTSATC